MPTGTPSSRLEIRRQRRLAADRIHKAFHGTPTELIQRLTALANRHDVTMESLLRKLARLGERHGI